MIALAALAGGFLSWVGNERDAPAVIVVCCACLIASAVYPTTVMTLQLFTSLRLPLAIRLVLVYAGVFSFLRALTFGIHVPVNGATVLSCSGICIGGFIQHQFRGWSVLGHGQQAEPPGKITIATLLDVTAAIAITIAIASGSSFEPKSFAMLLLPWLLMATVGMHGWGRLTALSEDRHQRDIGFAIWMTGNAMWACFIFLAFVLLEPHSPLALVGFVIAPLTVAVAHLTTAIPIAWLRACGWRFVLAVADDHLAVADDHSGRPEVQLFDLGVQRQRVVDVSESQESAGEQIQDSRDELAHVDPVDAKQSQEHMQ